LERRISRQLCDSAVGRTRFSSARLGSVLLIWTVPYLMRDK
jgi:hypothetical protein